MSNEFTEDQLLQKTTADYFHKMLGWESIYAYNEETYGANSTLGRESDRQIILTRYLRNALISLNPDLPHVAYDTAIREITETRFEKDNVSLNREKYLFFKNGVPVTFRNPATNQLEKKRLKVFDFENPENNNFIIVRELWISRTPYRRRVDLAGFVNGIPLLFIELKNVHRDIRRAYNENLTDYKDTIPHFFDSNAFLILSNGQRALLGSITSKFQHFQEWKRLSENDAGVVALETMLKGICTKKNFMDLFENFVLFDDQTGKLVKIIAKNHQYLGVNNAVVNVKNRKELHGQLGVFWHTQGSGKSYSMVFFAQKVHRKMEGNFSFVIITDREDLDKQIYKTFAGCGIVNNDNEVCRASSGEHLRLLLTTDKKYLFTMMHKFNQDTTTGIPYSERSDIIVISDEAHRTQYGRFALNMRNALPNAHFIGFTGTPLFKDDEITKRIFGGYVSKYDFQRAVEDNATVPLFYDNRGEKLHITTTEINEAIAEKLETLELDIDQQAALERDLSREYHIISAEKRLDAIAQDFVWHYTTRWQTGKCMLVCIDKVTTLRMHNLIMKYWKLHESEIEKKIKKCTDQQEEIHLVNHLKWVQETEIQVIVSEEQNEIKKFSEWNLDIVPHREKMKKGYVDQNGRTLDLDLAFKNEDHPFRVAIVCAMWLTGFDVPSLSTLYLDKPVKAHTLMQAIARANRVSEGKNNGLIVDYCGILKNLRKALSTFATDGNSAGTESSEVCPIKSEDELLQELAETIALVKEFLRERNYSLDAVTQSTGFKKIAAITQAKEVINQSEETRKRFEIITREVFKKFKSCITIKGLNTFVKDHDSIEAIYRQLQEDKMHADIGQVIREMHKIIDESIEPIEIPRSRDSGKIYDISAIDFDKLKEEFSKSPKKNTTVQCLKDLIETKLKRMIDKNPLRNDYYKRYQEIIADYNLEKDRITIEKTFEELMRFVQDLDDEEKRTVREGLSEEHLALFDILAKAKNDLSTQTRNRIKKVAIELLDTLKNEKLKMDHWREKEKTRSEVKSFIHDFLWDENKGLPTEAFTNTEVELTAEAVFDHIYRQYEDSEKNKYAA